MSNYRMNVRFNLELPRERRAAECLKRLGTSRNRFVVDAVIAELESRDQESMLRRILQDELQNVAFITPSCVPEAPKPEALTVEEQAQNAQNILEDLSLFG